MSDKTGNARAKRLYDKRIEAGLTRLNDWVPAKVKARLDAMAARSGKTRAEMIEELVQRA